MVNQIITYTNSKLGGQIGQLNMPKGLSCRANAPCAKICYGNHGNLKFKNVVNGHIERFNLYKSNPQEFFERIDGEIKSHPFTKLYRIHSMGDIPDFWYFVDLCTIAQKYPDRLFLMFTKKTEIVNHYMECVMKGEFNPIPKNFTVVFSAWGDFVPFNPYNFPVAYVNLQSGEGKEYIPSDSKKCMNQLTKHEMTCQDCFLQNCSCWQLKKGESVVFDQH